MPNRKLTKIMIAAAGTAASTALVTGTLTETATAAILSYTGGGELALWKFQSETATSVKDFRSEIGAQLFVSWNVERLGLAASVEGERFRWVGRGEYAGMSLLVSSVEWWLRDESKWRVTPDVVDPRDNQQVQPPRTVPEPGSAIALGALALGAVASKKLRRRS